MKKKFRKRVLIWSLMGAFLFLLTVMIIFGFFQVIQPYLRTLKEKNRLALEKIKCTEKRCDMEEYWNYPPMEKGPEYILVKFDQPEGKFFLNFPPISTYRGFRLNFSEPTFIEKFREPKSYQTLAGEQYRMFSKNKIIDDRNYEIIVGWGEKRAERMVETPVERLENVDQKLKEWADKIAKNLEIENGKASLPADFAPKVDAYQVVNAETKEMEEGAWGFPSFFPKDKPLLKKRFSLWLKTEERDLYLVRTDENENLLATSLNKIANLWTLIFGGVGILLFGFGGSYLLGQVWFKKYLVKFLTEKPPSLDEALKSGEGEEIEFKRGIVDEEILKSIAAFANTSGGTLFLGVDDQGHLKGLEMRTLKEKDYFKDRLHNLVRKKINPAPYIKIDFEEIRGYTIAKIFVPFGLDIHHLNGVIYLRDGNSDVTSEKKPELFMKVQNNLLAFRKFPF